METEPLLETPSQSERRHEQRRIFTGAIEIEWGSATLAGTVRNIGPGGLFIELTPPLWIGATFSAHLRIQPPLLLLCTVNRIEPSKGIAVTFTVPEEQGRAQLEALLAALPAK